MLTQKLLIYIYYWKFQGLVTSDTCTHVGRNLKHLCSHVCRTCHASVWDPSHSHLSPAEACSCNSKRVVRLLRVHGKTHSPIGESAIFQLLRREFICMHFRNKLSTGPVQNQICGLTFKKKMVKKWFCPHTWRRKRTEILMINAQLMRAV